MLDIIIPVYNSKNTLFRTLNSIAIQTFKEFKVYLINDCDNLDYQEEIDFFSKYFFINEIKLNKNSGPGIARQKGIDKSNSKYILFIDSDDYLYNEYSLYNLINEIEKGYDLIISDFIYERYNEITIKQYDFTWLHGKIYRRDFLEKEQIRFNDSRSNEDNGFNRLIILSTNNYTFLNQITYVYSENKDSITRKNDGLYKYTGLEGFVYNMNWAMNIMINKNKNLNEVALTSISVLVSMYYYYLELQNIYDSKNIFLWCKDTKRIYENLKYYISSKDIEYFMEDMATEYPNIDKVITFDEFLRKVDTYND